MHVTVKMLCVRPRRCAIAGRKTISYGGVIYSACAVAVSRLSNAKGWRCANFPIVAVQVLEIRPL